MLIQWSQLFIFALLSFIPVVFADHENIVNVTDSSLTWSAFSAWEPFSLVGTNCGADVVVNHTNRYGDSVTLDFKGTAIYLDIVVFTTSGSLSVALDGNNQQVRIDRPGPYPDDAPSCVYYTAYSSTGLEDKQHSIKVTYNSSFIFDELNFVSFRYAAKDSTGGFSPKAGDIAGIVIGCVAFVVVVTVLYRLHRKRRSGQVFLPASTHPAVVEVENLAPLDAAPARTGLFSDDQTENLYLPGEYPRGSSREPVVTSGSSQAQRSTNDPAHPIFLENITRPS